MTLVADPLEAVASWWLGQTRIEAEVWLSGASLDEVTVVEQALAQRRSLGWRNDPAAMAHHLTGGTYRLWHYIRFLADRFRAAVRGESKRQIWNIATRYGKSLLASGWGPAWTFDQHPDASFILVSYGHELAMENAVFVRDVLRNYAGQLNCQLRADRQRMDRFVTEQGGGLLAAGIDGRITGFGVKNHGGVVIDDPYKNWQEAHSLARREHVNNQYRAVIRNRIDDEDTGWIIATHARWHVDDFSHFLEDESGEAWEIVSLPTIAAHDDLLGRAPGELLEPERFNAHAVEQRHRALGSYLTSAMEQQSPTPEEGSELRRSWWRWYDDPPAAWDLACVSWDMKMKEKRAGDYVVGQVWVKVGSSFYGLAQLRGQWSIPTVKAAMALLAVRYPGITRHYIENTGNGPEVIAELRQGRDDYELSEQVIGELKMTPAETAAVEVILRRGMTGLLPVTPKGDKVARARAEAGALEAGDVYLPLGQQWADMFVDEAAAFPPDGAGHDDMVDAWSQALAKLRRTTATVARLGGPAARRVATLGGR